MGIFSSNVLNESVEDLEPDLIDEFQEAWIAEQVSRAGSEMIQEFCAPGGDGELLVEARKMRKKTLVRLSKNDDLNRRETMACLVLAKRNKDPLWTKLSLNRVKEKQLLGKIKQKYSSKGTKLAKAGQKEYLKQKMPAGFKLFGGADR